MHNKKRKAIVLSMMMGALMLLSLTTNAQYREDRYGLQEWGHTSLLGKQVGGNYRSGETTGDFTNDEFTNVPNGSGLAILIGAGLGYMALKKKEDGQ